MAGSELKEPHLIVSFWDISGRLGCRVRPGGAGGSLELLPWRVRVRMEEEGRDGSATMKAH